MTRTLAELACAVGLRTQPEWREIEIRGVTEDSRRVRPGFLFVAIRGLVDDGHRHIARAVAAGAAAVAAEKDAAPAVPCLVLADGRKGLALLAAAFFGSPTKELFTVGVTGTKGKTTVCHLVAHLLGQEKTCVMSTVANEERGLRAVTTPSSPLIQEAARHALDSGQTSLVLEVSSAALALHRADCIDFDVAAFTNLTHDHLDFHRNMDEYLAAKLLLFSGLRDDACAVVNRDDPAAGKVLSAARGERLTFGLHREADLRALSISLGARDTRCTLRFRGEEARVRLALPGEHNVYNALAAAGVAAWRGMPLAAIADRLSTAANVVGRYEFLEARNGASVVIDFAHSPDSLERMLESLRPFYARVICVFGCGGNSDRKKRPIMGRISGQLAHVTILTCDNPKAEDPVAIIDEIEEGIRPTGGAYERIPDRRCAIRRALELASPKDVVLLAGKGHETYQIVGKEFLPYSDAEFLREEGLAR